MDDARGGIRHLHFLPQSLDLLHVMKGMDGVKSAPLANRERAKNGMEEDPPLIAKTSLALLQNSIHFCELLTN